MFIAPSEVVVVIPTFNEVANITNLIDQLLNLYPGIRIMVVDDHSPDGTAVAVRACQSRYQTVSLLSRLHKDGLGAAYKEALTLLKNDQTITVVVTMDADGSHDPRAINELVNALQVADLAIGSRYCLGGKIVGWNLGRRLLSRFGNYYVHSILQTGIHDMTTGFTASRWSLLKQLNLATVASSGYAYLIEFKYACWLLAAHIQEVPITFRDRQVGVSKMTWGIAWEGILLPLRLKFRVAKKLFS